MIEKSLVILKPDAVQRGLMGNIISRFENMGMKVTGMKMKWVDRDFSKKHYKDHVEKPFYKGLEDFIVEGPVLAFVIEGVDAIETTRKLVGSTEPKKAAPGTIRGDFAHHSYAHSDEKGIAIKNLIHASDSVENAQKEIGLWFDDDEVHSYQTVHEKHVF
jgi:nucleoside-diphosphate kinase